NDYVFKIDGITTNNVSLTEKNYNSIDELATELQTRINTDKNIADAGVSVSVQNNRGKLEFTSNKFGSGSRVALEATDTLSNLLGLNVATGQDGVDVAGTIANVKAIGAGQTLTGTRNVEGLAIKVVAGDKGERQAVVFSRGVAEQLDLLLNKLNDTDGVLSARDKGASSRLEDITKQRDVLARRLVKLEERLMKQFTALDSSLGKMRKTSEFLTNQLGTLPGPRTSNGR
ncbi:MAG: flagellar filament capping protein FliD, partial [Gammaproteobacteria bacterium]